MFDKKNNRNIDQIRKSLEDSLGKDKIKTNLDISKFTTIKIKTVADFFFEAVSKEDLIAAKKISLKLNIPILILGGGSNVIIQNLKPLTLIVKNSYLKKEIIDENKEYINLLVSSGYPVSKLVRETAEKGWKGFEYHLGLPGTIGGAIYMNSKWTKPVNYMGDNLVSAYLIDNNGKVKKVDHGYFKFAYDTSILQKTKEILLEAVFKLKKTDNPQFLLDRAQEVFNYRKLTQPFGTATCGCFFRNIDKGIQKKLNLATSSAGYLINKSGLKGLHVGDFIISDKHANFIINQGEGKIEDLISLITMVKKRVKEKFDVELKEEVVII